MGMGMGLKLMGMGWNGKAESHSRTSLVHAHFFSSEPSYYMLYNFV